MMDFEKNIMPGYILAGGKSSRMGTDKGLLSLGSKPLIQYVIEKLEPAVEKIVIVSNNPEYRNFGFEVINDVIKDCGPAGGIHSALNHCHSRQVFVVSCDLPFISTQAARYIIQNAALQQITIPVYHERTEPLFAVYTNECLKKWQELIEHRIIKLHDMVSYFKLLKLNVSNNELFNELTFTNINDVTDFQNAVKQLGNGN